MGQYWIPVNLDKREYISPHKFGAGLKLWEQLAGHPGTGAALIVLCAAQREQRGGGDFDMESNRHMPDGYPAVAKAVIGRWAGDRIALVGDYAEAGDLAEEHQAHLIYGLCATREDRQGQVEHLRRQAAEAREKGGKLYGRTVEQYLTEAADLALAPLYTDISDMVVQVMEHELNGKFEGEGWRQWQEATT